MNNVTVTSTKSNENKKVLSEQNMKVQLDTVRKSFDFRSWRQKYPATSGFNTKRSSHNNQQNATSTSPENQKFYPVRRSLDHWQSLRGDIRSPQALSQQPSMVQHPTTPNVNSNRRNR